MRKRDGIGGSGVGWRGVESREGDIYACMYGRMGWDGMGGTDGRHFV
jgi:hypothetical protein